VIPSLCHPPESHATLRLAVADHFETPLSIPTWAARNKTTFSKTPVDVLSFNMPYTVINIYIYIYIWDCGGKRKRRRRRRREGEE
jgi:hypothetical protein